MNSFILYLNPTFLGGVGGYLVSRSSNNSLVIPTYFISGLYTRFNLGVSFTCNKYFHLGKSNSNKVFDKHMHDTIFCLQLLKIILQFALSVASPFNCPQKAAGNVHIIGE